MYLEKYTYDERVHGQEAVGFAHVHCASERSSQLFAARCSMKNGFFIGSEATLAFAVEQAVFGVKMKMNEAHFVSFRYLISEIRYVIYEFSSISAISTNFLKRWLRPDLLTGSRSSPRSWVRLISGLASLNSAHSRSSAGRLCIAPCF